MKEQVFSTKHPKASFSAQGTFTCTRAMFAMLRLARFFLLNISQGIIFWEKSKLSKKHDVKQHKSLGFYFNYYKQKVPKITNKKEGGVRKEREKKMFSRLVSENKTEMRY